jgi:hypothetical protein
MRSHKLSFIFYVGRRAEREIMKRGLESDTATQMHGSLEEKWGEMEGRHSVRTLRSSRCFLPSPEHANRSSFQHVPFYSYLEFGTMDRVQKSSDSK